MKRYPLSGLTLALENRQVLLICSASFEDRCFSVPNALRTYHQLSGVFCLYNIENQDFVGSACKTLSELFPTIFSEVKVSGSDPLATADSLIMAVTSIAASPPELIVIDVSTMMRETLLILLACLHDMPSLHDRVLFCYVPAIYNQTQNRKRPELSFGIVEVRSVLGYPGEYAPGQPRHLVLLTGFEASRARAVIADLDPSVISLGVGKRRHSTSNLNATLDKKFADEIKADYPSQCRVFAIYPDDAVATADAIERQIVSVGEYKPLVCAMNTKISTCGAAIAAWKNPAISLTYAQPALYNHLDYSRPQDEVIVFNLPFPPFDPMDYSGSDLPS